MGNDFFAKKPLVHKRPKLAYFKVNEPEKNFVSHDSPEILFVAGGSGRIDVFGGQYPLRSGDVIVISKNVEHSIYMFESDDAEFYAIGLTDFELMGMPENTIIEQPYCIAPTKDRAEIIKALFRAIRLEEDERQSCSKSIEEDLLNVIMINAIRFSVYDMGITYSKNKAFFEAKDYIDKNYTKIVSIESVCEHLNINKFYLTHIFKEQIDMPPIKYLIYKRMKHAKQLLISDNGMSINEIAEECGYSDTAYFCRVFKKTVDITPLQYKIKHLRRNKKPTRK